MLQYSIVQLLHSSIPYIQIILSIILMALILLQQSEASLGAAFGAGSDFSFHVKRGAERTLFIATIVTAVLFVAAALIALTI